MKKLISCFSHTYEVAPVFVLVECAVLQHVLNIVGFPNGDGIFSPGNLIKWFSKLMWQWPIHYIVIMMGTVLCLNYMSYIQFVLSSGQHINLILKRFWVWSWLLLTSKIETINKIYQYTHNQLKLCTLKISQTVCNVPHNYHVIIKYVMMSLHQNKGSQTSPIDRQVKLNTKILKNSYFIYCCYNWW